MERVYSYNPGACTGLVGQMAFSGAVINTADKLCRLGERTDRAWFSCRVRHLARKWSGSILTTPEPARGLWARWPLVEQLSTTLLISCVYVFVS